MDVQDLIDEASCTRLCHELMHLIDQRSYDRAAALFVEDARFDRRGQIFAGRAAIRGFFESRPADEAIRHLCTNVRITIDTRDAARGHCYAVFYKGTAWGDADLPVVPRAPAVTEYHDEYVRTGDGWRFRLRRTQPVFQP